MSYKLPCKLIGLTPSCWAAIDAARGDKSRAAFLEDLIWRSTLIRRTSIAREPRPLVGKYDRTHLKKETQE